jgi:protein SCO1/2
VPLELWFSDAAGRRIQLGELFGRRKPVLLVMAYVRCRLLCSLVLHGTTELVRSLPLALGRDYEVVIVSIDPAEDAASAAARRRELLQRIGRTEDAPGWTYLVGAERPIRALADALGFRYTWDQRTEQFAHPAVLFVLAPDGTISRSFQAVRFDPLEVAASLRAAAAGTLGGSSIAETVLGCFRFDPAARAHRENIDLYLRIGASAILLTLGSSVLFLFVWERRRRRS